MRSLGLRVKLTLCLLAIACSGAASPPTPTPTSTPTPTPTLGAGGGECPTWSPDGTQIAYRLPAIEHEQKISNTTEQFSWRR